jgi:hypothetical protein
MGAGLGDPQQHGRRIAPDDRRIRLRAIRARQAAHVGLQRVPCLSDRILV